MWFVVWRSHQSHKFFCTFCMRENVGSYPLHSRPLDPTLYFTFFGT